MGARGPKPAPTALKLLRGESKSDRINRNEPVPDDEPIVMPEWLKLSERALAAWERLAPRLQTVGVLTSWDVDAFATYCMSVAIHEEACEMVAKSRVMLVDPRTSMPMRNPAVGVAREWGTAVISIGGVFGLNPSDRQNLRLGEYEEDHPVTPKQEENIERRRAPRKPKATRLLSSS